MAGCSTTHPVATSTASPYALPNVPTEVVSHSPLESPSPSPSSIASPLPLESPSPLPIGSPVERKVLAPAAVTALVDLCSQQLEPLQNGNVYPRFCRSGAVNELAWKWYVPLGSNVMSLGRASTVQEVESAICADQAGHHATKVEESYVYELAAAYYGWHFATDPTQVMYNPPYCS